MESRLVSPGRSKRSSCLEERRLTAALTLLKTSRVRLQPDLLPGFLRVQETACHLWILTQVIPSRWSLPPSRLPRLTDANNKAWTRSHLTTHFTISITTLTQTAHHLNLVQKKLQTYLSLKQILSTQTLHS